MDIRFRIFGAPKTFDLYGGVGEEITYFQKFDDPSKENVKLTIHRRVDGKVSYSYLRYNFVASNGRANSFFGMSIIFNNQYCQNIRDVYDLFDAAYDHISENNWLLTKLKGNPNAQAKYVVETFEEESAEVENVKQQILNNLEEHLANDILSIDSSFLPSRSMIKLNMETSNDKFVTALRKHSWVSISPEYSKQEEVVPNSEFLQDLDDVINKVQARIPELSIKAVKGGDIQTEVNVVLQETNNTLTQINNWITKEAKISNTNSYLQKHKNLGERREKLIINKKTLEELKKAIAAKPSESGQKQNKKNNKNTEEIAKDKVIPTSNTNAIDPTVGGNTSPSGTNATPESKKDTKSKTELPLFLQNAFAVLQKYKKKILIGMVGIIAIHLASFFVYRLLNQEPNTEQKTEASKKVAIGLTDVKDNFQPNTEQKTEASKKEVNQDTLIARGNRALEGGKYDEAIKNFKEANRSDLVTDAAKKAVDYYYSKPTKSDEENLKNLKTADTFCDKYNLENYDYIKKTIQKVKKKIDDAKKDARKIAAKTENLKKDKKPQKGEEKATGDGKSHTVATPPREEESLTYTFFLSKQLIKINDEFTATAKTKNGTKNGTSNGGEWSCDNKAILQIQNPFQNPTTIKALKKGKVTLRYYYNGIQKAAEEITINN